MSINIPLISNIYVEKNFENNFQELNAKRIVEKINSFTDNNNKKIKVYYLDIEEINKIKNDSLIHSFEVEQNTQNKKSYDLIIQKNPGVYIKKCPGTPNYICCNYFITTFYENCTLNCTYCFLKFYLKNNYLIIYYDIDNFFNQLGKFKSLRIGSGELSDSLLFDPFTNYSTILMDNLKNFPSILFEFKTKTTFCDPFFSAKPLKNIIIGFSMNPINIAQKFEALSANVEDRLKIAKDLANIGWKVSFHFDPIILTKNDDYNEYIELFKEITTIPETSIAWFSIGSLRYHPDMVSYLREDILGKELLNYETIYGLDGKIRYYIKKRMEIYKKIFEIYRDKNLKFPLYFCMESDRVYYETFGNLPNKIDNLKDIFTF